MCNNLLKVIMLMAMLMLFTQLASATAVLSLWDGNMSHSPQVIYDTDNDGYIVAAISIGVWKDSVTVMTQPTLGSSTEPEIHLSVSELSSSGGTLTIWFSQTDFSQLPPNFYFQNQVGGVQSPVGTISVQTYYDPSNTANVLSTSPSLVGTLATSQSFNYSPFSGTASSVGIPQGLTGLYSITEQVVITHNGKGVSSLDADLVALPEPSALLLIGFGLSSLGLLRLRKGKGGKF